MVKISPTYDSPPSLIPMSQPPEDGVVDAVVPVRVIPRRRRIPLPIEDGRPESAFIAEKSFEEEDIGVDLGGGDEPSTEVATSGGAGRTKRWGGRDAASSSKPMWRVSYEWRDLGAKLGGSDPRGLVEEMDGGGVEEASARDLALSCRQRLKERESKAKTVPAQ